MQRRVFRLMLLVSLLPAVALGVRCRCGDRRAEAGDRGADRAIPELHRNSQSASPQPIPKHYRVEVWTLCYSLFLSTELILSMILILLVGPDLISQDLRFNALPLVLLAAAAADRLFSRQAGSDRGVPGHGGDRAVVLAYVLGLLFSLDLTIVRDTCRLLLASIAYGLVIIVSAGTLMLALSSLSRNSRYVALFWVGLWFVSGIVSSVLEFSDQVSAARQRYRLPVRRQRRCRPSARRGGGRSPGGRRRSPLLSGADRRSLLGGDRGPKTDWRPLVSYTANLSRIGSQLLGTDAAWRKLAELSRSPPERDRYSGGIPGPAISLVLVGRRAGRSLRNFRMHPEPFRPIAGPTEMTPIVEFHESPSGTATSSASTS